MNHKVLLWAALSALLASTTAGREKWTPEQARSWQQKQSWLVGCNFSPSTAINQLEMWQANTFDPSTIDRELNWAQQLGFNSVRVYLHNLLWDQDRDGFLQRMEQFLDLADGHGIGVMFVLLDGVWDPQPKLGPQRAPRPHVHNSGWLQAPGSEILANAQRHDELRPYVFGVVRHFRSDQRIHAWDIFNEGDNPNTNSYGPRGANTELKNKAEQALLLTRKLFTWAREADPAQPITAGVWRGNWSSDKADPFNRLLLKQSDIITFHCYGPVEEARRRVAELEEYDRPLLCTEFMARPTGSKFDPVLGFFRKQKVAAYNWGFVAGKTQTNYPWDSWQKRYSGPPDVWFHEILHNDGTAYDEAETQYIKRVTGAER